MIEAKAKIKIRHQKAITQFQTWMRKHPEAPIHNQVEIFDRLVDKYAA